MKYAIIAYAVCHKDVMNDIDENSDNNIISIIK